MGHCLFKLQTAPAHIAQLLSVNFDGCSLFEHGPGLVLPLPFYKDLAFHNDGLGLLSGFCQASVYQKHVQTYLHIILS